MFPISRPALIPSLLLCVYLASAGCGQEKQGAAGAQPAGSEQQLSTERGASVRIQGDEYLTSEDLPALRKRLATVGVELTVSRQSTAPGLDGAILDLQLPAGSESTEGRGWLVRGSRGGDSARVTVGQTGRAPQEELLPELRQAARTRNATQAFDLLEHAGYRLRVSVLERVATDGPPVSRIADEAPRGSCLLGITTAAGASALSAAPPVLPPETLVLEIVAPQKALADDLGHPC